MAQFTSLADPVAAVAIYDNLCRAFDNNGMTNTAMLLCAIASAGGFACQQAVWKTCIEPNNRNPGDFLWVAGTQSGESLYFGEPINMFLVGAPETFSFYSAVAGIAPNPGPGTLPNLGEIFQHVTSSAGSPGYWDVRVPKPLPPLPSIRTALNSYWHPIQEILLQHGNPASQWPVILGFAAARIGRAVAKDLPATLVVRIIMEAAIIASKADPRTVPGATSGLRQTTSWSNRALLPATRHEAVKEASKYLPKRIPA